jgi:hypothetical protein
MNLAIAPVALAADPVRRTSTWALLFALAGGLVTQALFFRAGLGANFLVWDLLSIAGIALTFRRGPLSRSAIVAMAGCVALGLSFFCHQSEWASVTTVPATLLLLAALPILVRDEVAWGGLSDLPARMLATLRETPDAAVATVRLPSRAVSGPARPILGRLTRGLLLGIPTAGFFALLLAADPDFARALGRGYDALGDAASFAFWSLASAAGYAFTHALHEGEAALRSVAFGPSGAPPYRERPVSVTAEGIPQGRVSPLTWGIVVAQVALVFALFVGVNLRHLFGGAALVRAPGSLTYAAYLHAGFAELIFASILSVCLVLVGHALLRPRGASAELPVPGGRVLAATEGALVVLTLVTVASCAQRLAIYEDAYGASHLRLGVAFIEVTIAGVLLLTLGKIAARSWPGYGGAVLTLFGGVAVVAGVFNADLYVARTNLDRTQAGKPLDVEYLTSLTGDARAVLSHPAVLARPELAATLRARFCARPSGDWRSARGVGRCED